MDQFHYLYLVVLIPALVAAFFIARTKVKAKGKKAPEISIGAIRVTHQGRDMLIIRKEDGSFEMHEEQKIRKQCVEHIH
ncbi:MAG: hypothetical protein AB9866_26250 [Syntrophobacteraceae bacterium]